MAQSVTQPAPKQFVEVPTIRLTSARYAGSSWSPHGLNYGIEFDKNGEGFILETHFDDHIGFDLAKSMGMTATRMTAGDANTRRVANEQPTR